MFLFIIKGAWVVKVGGLGGGASQASPWGDVRGDRSFLFGKANEVVKEQLRTFYMIIGACECFNVVEIVV